DVQPVTQAVVDVAVPQREVAPLHDLHPGQGVAVDGAFLDGAAAARPDVNAVARPAAVDMAVGQGGIAAVADGEPGERVADDLTVLQGGPGVVVDLDAVLAAVLDTAAAEDRVRGPAVDHDPGQGGAGDGAVLQQQPAAGDVHRNAALASAAGQAPQGHAPDGGFLGLHPQTVAVAVLDDDG